MSQLGSWRSQSVSPYQQKRENGHKSRKSPAGRESAIFFFGRGPSCMFIIIYLSDSWNSSSPSFGPGDGVLSETQAKHLESEKVHYRSRKIGAGAAKNEKNVKKCAKILQKIQKSISALDHRGQKKSVRVALSPFIYWHSSWQLL